MAATGSPNVLVAEDERHLAEVYTDYLVEDYDVVTAYGGEEALEQLRTREFDVALLDRRMPDLSGDKVLASVSEDGIDVHVAMVTAVNPGFDLVDMGCDDYLVKPVSKGELRETVDRLHRLSEYSEKHQELTAKKLKRNVLRVEKSRPKLEDSSRYERLESDIESLEDDLADIGEDLDIEDLQRHI